MTEPDPEDMAEADKLSVEIYNLCLEKLAQGVRANAIGNGLGHALAGFAIATDMDVTALQIALPVWYADMKTLSWFTADLATGREPEKERQKLSEVPELPPPRARL
jgi:hypothetical protein